MELCIAAAGLLLGSFLCCLCDRMLLRQTLWDYSRCEYCHHRLHVLDLFPVISFVLVKGRCRYCHQKLRIAYPLFELSSGFLCLLAYEKAESISQLLFYGILFESLLCLSYCDFKEYVIPDLFVCILLFLRLSDTDLSFVKSLSSCAMIVLPLFLLCEISFRIRKKEVMGMGDLKLYGVLASYFAFEVNLLAIFLSCLFGLAVVLLSHRKKIPFGPCIALAYGILFLYETEILSFYQSLF